MTEDLIWWQLQLIWSAHTWRWSTFQLLLPYLRCCTLLFCISFHFCPMISNQVKFSFTESDAHVVFNSTTKEVLQSASLSWKHGYTHSVLDQLICLSGLQEESIMAWKTEANSVAQIFILLKPWHRTVVSCVRKSREVYIYDRGKSSGKLGIIHCLSQEWQD